MKIKYLLLYVILLLFFVYSCKPIQLSRSEGESLRVYDSLGIDSLIFKKILPYSAKLDSSMNVVIGYSEANYEKGVPESALGNFFSDVLVDYAKRNYQDFSKDLPIISLLNNGGLRAALPKGEITLRNIFQIMPFDNEIVLLKLKGQTLKEIFPIISSKGGMPVGGVQITFNGYDFKSASIGGKEFNEDDYYILITSDYLANGGDDLTFLSNNEGYLKTGILMRNEFIDYIKKLTSNGQTVKSKVDGRIKYE